MSDERAAMLERFRAGLVARVERIEGFFDGGNETLGAAEKKEALGELHTLKGEARMLGLVQLAELAHTLETHLGQGATGATVLPALDAVQRALAPTVAPEIADAVIEAAHLELGPIDGAKTPAPSEHTDTDVTTNGDDPPTNDADSAPAEETRANGRRYVQVDAATVDALCERLSELGALYGRLRGRTLALLKATPHQARALADIGEDFARVSAVVQDTTTNAWRLRLVPVEPVLRELRRHARRVAAESGKSVEVVVESRGVELERNVLDQLWDSLLHLVHNAVDHGLEAAGERGAKAETAYVALSAEARGPNVVFCVTDDGRGIDAGELRAAAVRSGRAAPDSDEEAFELLFDHGFSTRTAVSAVSGRGVGLAVVKRQLERLGGRVRVESERGQGTLFELTVPLTISKERCLVCTVGGTLFGFPARNVRAVLGKHELAGAGGQRGAMLRHRHETLPLVSLASALSLPVTTPDQTALILELGGRRAALGVGGVHGDAELIRRPAEALLGNLTGIGATALLEDGRLVLLLDPGFLERSVSAAEHGRAAPSVRPAGPRRPRVLLADDSPIVCQVVSEILTSGGCQVEITHDGTEAIKVVREREPDLVLSDVEMPQMGGFELLGEIRRVSQKLPVIMLTTRGSLEDRQRATELGANAYLLKTGFKSEALLDVVRRFLPSVGTPALAIAR